MSNAAHPEQLRNAKNIMAKFPGCSAPFTNELFFTNMNENEIIPIYRVMYSTGKIVENIEEPKLSKDVVMKMYKDMVLLNNFDKILYESQR